MEENLTWNTGGKNKGILYDDSVFRIRRDAELERWKRWKRNLTRECVGNYGTI